jgi:hypothetical protein
MRLALSEDESFTVERNTLAQEKDGRPPIMGAAVSLARNASG